MELTNKGRDTRKRIIETAVTMFSRKGFAETGLRELAKEAEVNLAMINYFFGSKKGLLKEILDEFYSGYLALVDSQLRGPEEPYVKIRRYIHHAIDYIDANSESMIIVLAELPHDDPEITEYKAAWANKTVIIIKNEICVPLKENHGIIVSPAVLGPLLISMMCSRFLFASVLQKVAPPGLQEEFIEKYPDLVAGIFLNGLNGLKDANDEKTIG